VSAVTCIRSEELESPGLLRRMLDEAFDGGFRDADWHHARGGWHFLVAEAGAPVAHAAVVERTLVLDDWEVRTAYVEAVATHADHRRRGHGSAVMRSVGAFVEAGYRLGGLSAGIPAFYERFGWQRWCGSTFVRQGDRLERTPEDDGTVMVLPTSTSAAFDRTGPIHCSWRPGEVW